MVKTHVIERENGETKFPFLRGILTRSLQDAGLSFDEAYALATSVRESFSETPEITTAELRKTVMEHISRYGPAIVQRYQHPAVVPGTILVRDASGHARQFSREQHRRVLESSGLSYEDSAAVTSAIFSHLVKKGVTEIWSRQLGHLTYRYLRVARGPEAARSFLVLVNYFRGKRPLVLMIGGAPGTGKSAVATEIAQRLEIVRIQSTDLLREVMRMMIPERLLPVLQRSSYDAWKTLPGKANLDVETDTRLIDGYRAQADLLSVPCEAVIRRSLREQASLVLEGVHVQHGLMDKLPASTDAIVIPIMLAVLNPGKLKDRFTGRGKQLNQRRAERYLQHFDSIWRLQSYLLSEADRWQTPIIVNDDREQVVRDAMATIIHFLSEEVTAQPADVFT